MTFDEFVRAVNKRIVATGERAGQAAYNLLWSINKEGAISIAYTLADPFYDNNNLSEFYAVVVQYDLLEPGNTCRIA